MNVSLDSAGKLAGDFPIGTLSCSEMWIILSFHHSPAISHYRDKYFTVVLRLLYTRDAAIVNLFPSFASPAPAASLGETLFLLVYNTIILLNMKSIELSIFVCACVLFCVDVCACVCVCYWYFVFLW